MAICAIGERPQRRLVVSFDVGALKQRNQGWNSGITCRREPWDRNPPRALAHVVRDSGE